MAPILTEKNKQEFFDIASIDSMKWLENAEFLKISADLIWKNILIAYKEFTEEHRRIHKINLSTGVFNKNRDKVHELEDKLKSFSNTYYLIIGYSFENLIKALSIEKNPGLSFKEIYDKHWKKYNSGHGISIICKKNIDELTQTEFELLERLEAYILWLGKYPVAIDRDRHVADYDKKYFFSDDKNENDKLFDKIKKKLLQTE
jgi:hypothetical protein